MLRVDRRLIAHFDWILLVLAATLVGLGLATIHSATHAGDGPSAALVRQSTWAGLGLVGLFVAVSFDYRWLDRYGLAIYGGSVLLLLFVAVLGTLGGGARRWIALGPFSVQPSEFAKLAVIVALAGLVHRRVGERPLALADALLPLLLVALPALLILKQPDLGTAIVVALTGGAVLLVAGLRLRWVLLAVLVSLPLGPLAWSHLKPYQQRRVMMFLDPSADRLGAGYHVIQSKIAIGSGQWSGKGYMNGTQNRLNFLPEQHTDFIFAVFAEEWGFVGAAVLLGLYLALLLRCFVVIARARDAFGVLLGFGVTVMIFSQVIVNVAMASGALPVVGVTLPFFSYGGSSLLVSLVGIGLLMNVSMRRYKF